MPQNNKIDPIYKILVRISIVLFVLFSVWLIWEHFMKRPPELKHYLTANTAFKDKNYDLSLKEYFNAFKYNKLDVYAIEGIARSYMELNQYHEAKEYFYIAINLDPNFAPAYANLGVLYDRQKQYIKAVTYYKKAISIDNELSEGMHWLDRLLFDVRETPPTILGRSKYIEEQLKLPLDERVLSIPELDEEQLNYEK